MFRFSLRTYFYEKLMINMSKGYTEPKIRGTLVFLQDLDVALREMAADSESSDTLCHLQYARQVSYICLCTWLSHAILTWTPYLLYDKARKMKYNVSLIFGSAYIHIHVYHFLTKINRQF